MSRVHCTDCGIPVVVDPNGYCPDGHNVGAAGARIESSMGVGTPHPDEPEPWVSSVEDVLDVTAGATDGSAGATTQTLRAPRPPVAPGQIGHASPSPASPPAPGANGRLPTTPDSPSAANGRAPSLAADGDAAAEADDLLRELHSLSDDLADLTAPSVVPSSYALPKPIFKPAPPAAAPPAAPSPAATPPAPTPPATVASTPTADLSAVTSPPDAATPPDDDAPMDGLAELRALEAAVHALTGSGTEDLPTDPPATDRPAIEPPSSGAPGDSGVVTPFPDAAARTDHAPDREQLAEVEDLFARRPRPLLEEPAADDAPPRPQLSEAPPVPAFERTPWSALPAEPSDASHSDSSTDLFDTDASSPAPARGRRSANPPSSSDDTLDLGNFTARGGRVGNDGGRRRRRGR